jgi:hypothetical protein
VAHAPGKADLLQSKLIGMCRRRPRRALADPAAELTLHVSPAAPAAEPPHLTPVSTTTVRVLPTTALRLLRTKLAKAAGLPDKKAIREMWAMLAPQAGPGADGALAGAGPAAGDALNPGDAPIVFPLDQESKALEWYQLRAGDAVVLVIG